jgi:hypothetical protein
MGLDFSTLVYLPGQDFFGREIIVTPIKSNPGAPAYTVRGIYETDPVDIIGEVGVMRSDNETILDIRDNEFFEIGQPIPIQGDLITIPADGNVPAAGDFEVMDADPNGGGETTLAIRKYEPAAP